MFGQDRATSANPGDVRLALDHGHASATIYTGPGFKDDESNEIRIAFDGDAVIFSDEAERVFQDQGLEEFKKHEAEKSEIPLPPGPLQPFFAALHAVQKACIELPDKPIRTALVTARSAPAHKRAIKTLRGWGIGIDEAFFLGGLDKAPILDQFRPHIFFDDQQTYCQNAAKFVATGHVPSGLKNG